MVAKNPLLTAKGIQRFLIQAMTFHQDLQAFRPAPVFRAP
jgi:hypothetical protein